VGVVETSMVVDLPSERGRMSLGDLLDRHACTGETMSSQPDLAEGALADGTSKGIVADGLETGGAELFA
jgi:hypothetical protein